ncbi:uncharacterized protein LOC109835360 [Asparagus officinalis]|uniref:uncharacterized protein LOC109835360 n=1 Tax=Asparagus officinalis TaxID=4686 RepID=UPI00098E2483|nr:uncharacterized protein LOC109835360 [Asparagus officinalis]
MASKMRNLQLEVSERRLKESQSQLARLRSRRFRRRLRNTDLLQGRRRPPASVKREPESRPSPPQPKAKKKPKRVLEKREHEDLIPSICSSSSPCTIRIQGSTQGYGTNSYCDSCGQNLRPTNGELHVNGVTVDDTQESPTTTHQPFSSSVTKRVTIHGHHPDEDDTTEGPAMGKLVPLSDSIEDLFKLAGSCWLSWFVDED